MIFRETTLAGVTVVEVEARPDERGCFARTFCGTEFKEAGLASQVSQVSVSFNKAKGTLRGMHLQRAPHEECKLVRCTRGRVFDVVVDLRPASPTHHDWFGLELDSESRRALFIPAGVAHGFLTLEDNSELLYMMDVPYAPDCADGVRWDDPAFGIEWPFEPLVMSDADRTRATVG